MKNALFVYLLAVIRTALFGLATWSLLGALKGWPVSTILAMAQAFAITASLAFSPYLLFPVAGYRVRQFLYFAPVLVIWILRGYDFYKLYSGQFVELSIALDGSIFKVWHARVVECLIVPGVCLSIYRRYKTFYDSDPVEELLQK